MDSIDKNRIKAMITSRRIGAIIENLQVNKDKYDSKSIQKMAFVFDDCFKSEFLDFFVDKLRKTQTPIRLSNEIDEDLNQAISENSFKKVVAIASEYDGKVWVTKNSNKDAKNDYRLLTITDLTQYIQFLNTVITFGKDALEDSIKNASK